MHGLAKGEASTSSVPILQLFVRQGEVLTDIVSGTYKIEDIHDPDSAPAEVVAEAAFDTTTHKLGTGRYWIPSGDTSSWEYGTHRVVCTYKLAASGPEYTEVIEFEVLDPADWPTGRSYLGHAATRRLIADGYVGATTAPRTLHRSIDTYSRYVEKWTGRSFGPTYRALRMDGPSESVLLRLDTPIIALEKVEAIWKDSDNDEQVYLHDNNLIRVYNRHLDSSSGPDDRNNPKLARLDSQAWGTGRTVLRVTGVFGYTEPDLSFADERVGVGKTPPQLLQIVGALLYRYQLDPTLSNPTLQQPGSIKQMKTRDQSITFATGGSSVPLISNLSGDITIDRMLIALARPPKVVYAGRRYGEQEIVDPHEEDFNT